MGDNTGFHGNKVHPWGSLVTRLWDDLLPDDRLALARYYNDDREPNCDPEMLFRTKIGR